MIGVCRRLWGGFVFGLMSLDSVCVGLDEGVLVEFLGSDVVGGFEGGIYCWGGVMRD